MIDPMQQQDDDLGMMLGQYDELANPDGFDPALLGTPELLTPEEQAMYGGEPEQAADATENLAEKLDADDLDRLVHDVIQDFRDDETSRQEWRIKERDGIRLLGISQNTQEPAKFEGACEVTFPSLVEAVVQFQARALAELWPEDGPVKSVVLGTVTPETQSQSDRVEQYLNYLYTEAMPGGFEELDRMLFWLPLSGSAFTKLCYDPLSEVMVKRFLPPSDVVVPYEVSDIRTAPRYTVITRYTRNDLIKLMKSGYFVDLSEEWPDSNDEQMATDQTLVAEVDAVEGRRPTHEKSRYVVYEQFRYADFGEGDDGVEMPYYVHVESQTQKVLAVYRAWTKDPNKPRHYVTHYRFLPGLGFYGTGYLHILSSLVRAQTGSLRALIDAAGLANLKGGFRSRDLRMSSDEPLKMGEWRDVDATSDEMRNGLFPIEYGEPSQTMFALLQWLDEIVRRVAGTVEVAVGDQNPSNAPVGTTLALLEQSQKVQSGVHIRLHAAQRQEFQLAHDLCHDYLPPEYPYFVEGEERTIKAEDFDDRVDVSPVSDPNIISAMQRVARAQAILELSNQAPDLYDRHAVHRTMLQALRVPFHEEILPEQNQVQRRDPVSEGMAMLMNEGVQAFPDQDHQAHILVHESWLQQLPPDQANQVSAVAMAHIAEHVALQYQVQMMQAMGLDEMPDASQDPQIEAQLTYMAAQAAQLMGQQQEAPPDPATEQAAAKAQADEMKTLAEIGRKDAEAEARIAREDAQAIAKMNREVAKEEQQVMRQALSDNAVQHGEEI